MKEPHYQRKRNKIKQKTKNTHTHFFERILSTPHSFYRRQNAWHSNNISLIRTKWYLVIKKWFVWNSEFGTKSQKGILLFLPIFPWHNAFEHTHREVTFNAFNDNLVMRMLFFFSFFFLNLFEVTEINNRFPSHIIISRFLYLIGTLSLRLEVSLTRWNARTPT